MKQKLITDPLYLTIRNSFKIDNEFEIGIKYSIILFQTNGVLFQLGLLGVACSDGCVHILR